MSDPILPEGAAEFAKLGSASGIGGFLPCSTIDFERGLK